MLRNIRVHASEIVNERMHEVQRYRRTSFICTVHLSVFRILEDKAVERRAVTSDPPPSLRLLSCICLCQEDSSGLMESLTGR